MSSPEKREEDPCCPMQLKTGVQIIAGVLAIISSVILVNYRFEDFHDFHQLQTKFQF
jgi:hypothetical protein